MDEAAFLEQVSTRLGRPTPTDPPQRNEQGAPDFWRQPSLGKQELILRFQNELEKLGGQVERFEDQSDMLAFLETILQELNPTRIGVWGGNFMKDHQLEEVLSPYEVVMWGDHGVEAFQSAEVSISGCAFAIADTGTMVMMSSETQGRSVAVLPTVHIVILREEQIHGTMGEVLASLSQMGSALPASVHFISGASRSSDIENDQTIGIHGPARIVAFIL